MKLILLTAGTECGLGLMWEIHGSLGVVCLQHVWEA